jgi:hypothetical protein
MAEIERVKGQARGWTTMQDELVQGGQGRSLDNRDGWLFWWLALACLLLGLLSGCGFDRTSCQPPGDKIDAPKKRATPQDHVERQYLGGERDEERLSEDEWRKFQQICPF